MISYFWNYEDRAHQTTDRALGKGNAPEERCISALAFDWDADGDHDILLVLETDKGKGKLPNDAVIICAGGILPTGFLKNIGIEVETKHGTA